MKTQDLKTIFQSDFAKDHYSKYEQKNAYKQFKIAGLDINYTSSCQLTQQLSLQNLDKNVNIFTKLVQSQQKSLTLITKIQIGKHKIQLKSNFQSHNKKQASENQQIPIEKKRKKNFYLVRRKPYNPTEKNKPKRKLKNSVRNIRRLFTIWIQQNDSIFEPELKQFIYQKFKKWPNSNSLIKFLIRSPKTQRIFKLFLEKYAGQLIINSKIKDKQAQLAAINSYLKLYQNSCESFKKQEQF